MRYLVFVRFLPGGALAPDEFFAHINAHWRFLEDTEDRESKTTGSERTPHLIPPRSAVCIVENKSIEELAIDLATMPGAGISNVEVRPISEDIHLDSLPCIFECCQPTLVQMLVP